MIVPTKGRVRLLSAPFKGSYLLHIAVVPDQEPIWVQNNKKDDVLQIKRVLWELVCSLCMNAMDVFGFSLWKSDSGLFDEGYAAPSFNEFNRFCVSETLEGEGGDENRKITQR